MGLIDFIKDAGERMFGGDDDKKQKARTADDAMADKRAAAKMAETVGSVFEVKELGVKFRDGVATVTGTAASQADREKIVLLLGNTQGVARVDDRLAVERKEPEATFYTVVRGDSLSKIAKAHYGDAMKYPVIFEANKPMLKDPDKIYPGQVLRIPPLD